jgi:hypothetical protein
MSRSTGRTFLFTAGLLGAALLVLGPLLVSLTTTSALAAPGYYQGLVMTPTPRPDGRIVYIVKPNDSLLSISLWSGVPVETLRGLNNLKNDIIFPDQELLLGMAAPTDFTPTPGPSPTPTEALPTPTLRMGTGTLCVLLYNDRNGDSVRQESEPSIPGGAIRISHTAGSFSATVETEESLEHTCFPDVIEGQYNVSVAFPDGFNATTQGNVSFALRPGDQAYLDFGAQPNSETLAEEPGTPGGSAPGRSPLLGILGGALLIGGLGLALVAGRLLKR